MDGERRRFNPIFSQGNANYDGVINGLDFDL